MGMRPYPCDGRILECASHLNSKIIIVIVTLGMGNRVHGKQDHNESEQTRDQIEEAFYINMEILNHEQVIRKEVNEKIGRPCMGVSDCTTITRS